MRTEEQRARKYKKKLRVRVDEQQKKLFGLSIYEQIKIERDVKALVGKEAREKIMFYMVFAKEFNKLRKKYTGENFIREAEILQKKWLMRGLDLELLNKIKKHYMPHVAWPGPFRLDISKLDGPDYLS